MTAEHRETGEASAVMNRPRCVCRIGVPTLLGIVAALVINIGGCPLDRDSTDPNDGSPIQDANDGRDAPDSPDGDSGATADAPTVKYLESWSEHLLAPVEIAVDEGGRVLVSDPILGHIARFDASGAALAPWSVAGGPLALARHTDGARVFIVLRDRRDVGIYNYDAPADTIRFTGAYLGDDGVSFTRPTDVIVAESSGDIYVADGGGDRVCRFDTTGEFVGEFGQRGPGRAEFRYPSLLTGDAARGLLFVGDQENYRIQVFDWSGGYRGEFGRRIRYGDDGAVGWMPRTRGMALDSSGNLYTSDGLMSAVRVCDAAGEDLGRVIEYGDGPGQLNAPNGLALSTDETRLYVANTGAGRVEVYEISAIPPPPEKPAWGVTINVPAKDPPDEIKDYGNPHFADRAIACQRCHGVTGQPGEHPATPEGQAVLCRSCHNAGAQAMDTPMLDAQMADPYGTNPSVADGRGTSHAWGVPAVNPLAGSIGPAVGGVMSQHLDLEGRITCGTCHDQHEQLYPPYLRLNNAADAMCMECHAPRAANPGTPGSHPVGIDFPGGDGEFPETPSTVLLKMGKVECLTCHAVHAADSGGANNGAGDGLLLRAANGDELCRTCHTHHIGHTPRGNWMPTCRDCHDVHASGNHNLALVAATVHNQTTGEARSVVFASRSGAGSFSSPSATNPTGICQICHTKTDYHRGDGGGSPHNAGKDCTVCHPHEGGFMPNCEACHDHVPEFE